MQLSVCSLILWNDLIGELGISSPLSDEADLTLAAASALFGFLQVRRSIIENYKIIWIERAF